MGCIDVMEGKCNPGKSSAVPCYHLPVTGTVVCEKEGTAEKAGKSAARAFDTPKQKLNEATR
jgi:hypothetical protein